MSDKPLLFARDGAIATLTLNRPQAGNAIDLPMARALMEAAIACDEDDAIRCVVLTGAGRLFCAGGDVAAFWQAGDRMALAEQIGTLTAQLAASATRALGRTRNLLLSSFETSLETQMEAEARAIAAGGRDSESREGLSAFAARRKPDFAGEGHT